MDSDLSPEAALLLACARTRLDEASRGRARAAAARGLAWDELLRTAELQGVAPLLHANLRQAIPGEVPALHGERLRRTCRGIAQQNLALAAELCLLVRELHCRGIPAIPFKGPVLAATAYGSLALRRFSDLDILVRPGDAGAARELLTGRGYRLGYHIRGLEYHYVDERRQITVDLHQRIASSYFPALDHFDVLWARSRAVPIAGGVVQGLAPEDAAFGLCVHLAKDYCTWKERLSQLCDLAELAAAEPALRWEEVLARARRVGGERVVLLGLWLTADVLGAGLPDAVAAGVGRDPEVARLGVPIRTRLLRQLAGSLEYLPYRGDSLVEDFRTHLAVRERRADKLRFVRDLARQRVRRLLTPTERDRRFLHLAPRFEHLYYLVRPIRLVWERLRGIPRGPRWPSLVTHRIRRTP